MQSELSGYGVKLLPVRSCHIEILRQWRNSDFVRAQMVSSEIISKQQQQNWFENIALRKDQQHFVIEYRNTLIGAANIKTADGRPVTQAEQLEPGIYIGDEQYRANILAFAPSLLLLDYCFNELEVLHLQAKVKKSNTAALSYNFKLGYREVDKDNEYVFIALTREQYSDSTLTLKNLLSRQRK